MKRFFLKLIGYPVRFDLRKFMVDRCDFCLCVIPEDEDETIIFFSYPNGDDRYLGQVCPECGKFFTVNDRKNLIRIFKDALRREFPIVPKRGLFEQKSIEHMNQILDSVQDYNRQERR